MEMIRLAEEEKPALELTPDIIQSVKSDSAISHSGVDEAYEIVCEVYGQIWEADDEDDLVEEITPLMVGASKV